VITHERGLELLNGMIVGNIEDPGAAPRCHCDAAVWAEVYQLQFAMADLTRALVVQDDTYIVTNLEKIGRHRARLVNALQTWKPELRIMANE